MSFSTYSPYLEDFNGYPSTSVTSWIFRRGKRDSILVLLCPSSEQSRVLPSPIPRWHSFSRGTFEGYRGQLSLRGWLEQLVYVSCPVFFAGEAVAKLIMGFPPRFRWVTFLVSKEALRHSHVWGSHEGCGRPLIFPTPMVLDMTRKATK
ncbi:hypothetical protein F2Q70_00035763 [Brassica cretica]|nr:hypothetical protein F2Q70_00035763 [Brassica cretica]